MNRLVLQANRRSTNKCLNIEIVSNPEYETFTSQSDQLTSLKGHSTSILVNSEEWHCSGVAYVTNFVNLSMQ